MSNVVYVDFGKPKLHPREAYIHMLAINLDENDFQDIIDALNDPNGAIYQSMDKDMQDLVDGFYAIAG